MLQSKQTVTRRKIHLLINLINEKKEYNYKTQQNLTHFWTNLAHFSLILAHNLQNFSDLFPAYFLNF